MRPRPARSSSWSTVASRIARGPGSAHPSATVSLGEGVRGSGDQRVLLAIGPEGGWNAFELDLLSAHGFQPAGIGPRTLRSDTACIALLAIAHVLRSG